MFATSPVIARSPAPHFLGPGVHSLEDARHASDKLNLEPATAAPLSRPLSSTAPLANPLLKREVFGFAPYWNLGTNAEWNYNQLSTIAYFGLDVNDDGGFANWGGGWDGWNSADFTTIINRAHASGVRVVVVVKDFRDASINTVLNTGARQNLINGVIGAIAVKNLDGVNVDFEGSGDPRFPDIPSGITGLMTDMSKQVHARWPQAQVSIDTYAGAASWDGGIFRILDLAPVVDAMFVMAYDSVFDNMPGQAGPNSPMTGWTYNDTVDVDQYLTKAPASKIILGVPYYGYAWSTTTNTPNAPTTNHGQAVTYSGVIDDLTCGAQGLKTGWDSVGRSPYAVWWSPPSGDPCGANLNTWRELYFDNATSLGIKYDLVNAKNLRGMGIWALGMDSGRTELWQELAIKFTAATPWSSLGGTLNSGPGVSSWGANADVFMRGSDNGLWHSSWNGSVLGSWAPLGGVLSADPGAVSWGPNRIDVFVRGSDNQMWHKFMYAAGQWSLGWEAQGGVLSAGPAVASWGAGRLDVFVRGTDNGLWHKWWDGSRWNGWEPLGGGLASDPAAVSWGPNRIDIFVRGTDNGLWHKQWDGSSWSGWDGLGGALTSAPDVASCGPGHLDVFALGANSALYRLGFNGAWGAWGNLGGQWTSKPAAVCAAGATGVSVFERGTDNALWQSSVQAS